DDLLELLGLELLADLGAHEQVGQPRTGAAQVPDVHHGRGELDVAHALAAHLRPRDLHTAALADDALEPDALVLAAVALPGLRRRGTRLRRARASRSAHRRPRAPRR